MVTALATLALAFGSCGGGDTVTGPAPAAPERLRVSSPAFAGGATIPARYTCSGENVSPPLAWEGVPARTRSLALLMQDPDAPGGTYVHWTAFDLPPTLREVSAAMLPAGAREGENSFGDRGYAGPCPPEGDAPHHYGFVIYALDAPLGLDAGSAPQAFRAAVATHAIARGTLTGRFGR